MMPPMLMKIAIYEKGRKKLNLWLPLILLYLLLLPVFLFLLPFLLIIGFVLWIFGVGTTPVSWIFWLYELLCASRGLLVEVQSKSDRVFIRIF